MGRYLYLSRFIGSVLGKMEHKKMWSMAGWKKDTKGGGNDHKGGCL